MYFRRKPRDERYSCGDEDGRGARGSAMYFVVGAGARYAFTHLEGNVLRFGSLVPAIQRRQNDEDALDEAQERLNLRPAPPEAPGPGLAEL